MADTEPTTARAQRLSAVRDGSADDAVERRSSGVEGGGQRRNVHTRSRQRDRRREIADDIDIEREGVGAVDRIAGGIDVFLRSVGVREFDENVSRQFAEEADFVEPGDVDSRVDGQTIAADPIVRESRRPDVARRARRETAADAQFIQAGDLDAEVGARGVSELAIPEGRRPTVAERAREGLAGDDPFATPGDFGVDVGARGITEAGLTDSGARRRAGRQFESETLLESVDPTSDLRDTDDGFTLREDRQRDIAAIELDPQFDRQDLTGEDIVATDDGFGPSEAVRRQSAAFSFADQTPLETVDPDADLQPAGDGFALDDGAQRRSAARGFEADIGLFETGTLDPESDIREIGDGFGLARDPARRLGAQQIDQELEDIDVSPDDVTLEETDSGEFEAVFGGGRQ